MATTEARMKQLTGAYADLNKSNMLVGEMAVPSDHVPIVRNGVNSWEDLLTSQSAGDIIALSETMTEQIESFEQLAIDKVGINDSTATLTQAYSGSKTQGLIDTLNTNLGTINSTKADKTALDAISAEVALKATQTSLNAEAITRAAEVAVERARITNLATLTEGSTTGDAELIEARVAFDATPYPNLGESIRGQIGKVLDTTMKVVNVNNATILPDFNNAQKNTTYVIFGTMTCAHSPFASFASNPVLLFNWLDSTEHIRNQIAICPNKKEYYYRAGYDNLFSDWVNMSERSTITVTASDKLTEKLTEAYQTGNVDVFIQKGTYDIYTELGGSSYFDSWVFADTEAGAGPLIGNGCHYYFAENSKVIFNYPGSNVAVLQDFSPLNAGNGDFILNGLTLECSRCRYAIHDEMGRNGIDYQKYYTHEIANCDIKLDNSSNTTWLNAHCIGGGLGALVGGKIYIHDNIFESVGDNAIYGNVAVSYHNGSSGGATTDGTQSIVIFKDNWIKGSKTFKIIPYGTSTRVTNAIVSNNRLGAQPEQIINVNFPENVLLYAFNNTIEVLGSVSSDYSSDSLSFAKSGDSVRLYGTITLNAEFPAGAGTALFTGLPTPINNTDINGRIENGATVTTVTLLMDEGGRIINWYTPAIASGSVIKFSTYYQTKSY